MTAEELGTLSLPEKDPGEDEAEGEEPVEERAQPLLHAGVPPIFFGKGWSDLDLRHNLTAMGGWPHPPSRPPPLGREIYDPAREAVIHPSHPPAGG